MIDRIDFTKSINFNNYEQDIKIYFDQIMALYDLIGTTFGGVSISTESKDQTSLRFILLTNSEEESVQLYDAINPKSISIYGHVYRPNLIRVNNMLTVALDEVVG